MIRLKGPKDIGQNILMHLESANGGSVIPLIFEQNGRTSQLESSLIQKLYWPSRHARRFAKVRLRRHAPGSGGKSMRRRKYWLVSLETHRQCTR